MSSTIRGRLSSRRRLNRAGCAVVSGRDLLIGQALLQIELMTGRCVAADVLYAALESPPTNRQHVEDF